MSQAWTFRPHHLLCWQTFRGQGYSPSFVANFQTLIETAGPEQPLLVAIAPDVVCRACPHQSGEGCTFQDKVLGLDRRVIQALGLKDGIELTLSEGLAHTKGRLHELISGCCNGCEWQPVCLNLVHEEPGHQL